MVIDRKKIILHHQYDEILQEINTMENKMKAMKEDLKHLKMITDKIGHNLELLGLEVDDILNKGKEAKPSQNGKQT